MSITQREYWSEVDSIAKELSSGSEYLEEYYGMDEPSDVAHQIIDGHEYIIYFMKALKVLEYSDNDDAYFEEFGEPPQVDSFSSMLPPLAYMAMMADVMSRVEYENPSRARRHGGGRRNFPDHQHAHLRNRYRKTAGAYADAAAYYGAAGDDRLQSLAAERAKVAGIKGQAHAISRGDFDTHASMAKRKGDSAEKIREKARAAWEDTRQNPPAPDGKWTKETEDTHVYPMGREYALVVKYAPRSFGIARNIGARYESALGRKVPKGTKYISVHGWYDPPQGRVLGAHKTLKAAKAAALKDLGVQARKNKPKKKSSNGFKVQVKTSARARPVKVSLPKSAKAQKVNGKVIHRSVSYTKGKLRLLKTWTVSTMAGLGIGKFKTKAAAVKRAKG